MEVLSPRVPRALDGLRILHFSDLHVDGRFRRTAGAWARQIADCPADLVIFTGDLVNHSRYWDDASRWLANLPLPAAVPRLAVPGNWDYRCGGIDPFRRCMDAAGFESLINHSRTVPVGDGHLQVAGFDDLRYGRFRPQDAMESVDHDQFVLALSHTPDLILHLDKDAFDLMLCGHTHGGQIRLPKIGALITSTRIGRSYAQGLLELAPHRSLYISRGIGEGTIPWRVLCPPELALFTLRTILGGT
jgi:predicted MPP superfamily phosphohydrolase